MRACLYAAVNKGDIASSGRRCGAIRRLPLRASRSAISALTRASISPAARRRKGRRISKRGSPQPRWAPVNAAWSVVEEPRPPHAFYERVRARRGHQIGVVASARKARRPALVPALPLGGPRPPAAPADGKEAAPAREPRRHPRRSRAPTPGCPPLASGCAKQSTARPTGRGPPTSERSQTGKQRRRRRRARARHRGAHRSRPLRGKVARQAHERQTPALRHVIGSRPDAAQRRPPASTDVDGAACANWATTGPPPPAAKPSSQEAISGPARALRDRPHPPKSCRGNLDLYRSSNAGARAGSLKTPPSTQERQSCRRSRATGERRLCHRYVR
jgi:hypothetical protein